MHANQGIKQEPTSNGPGLQARGGRHIPVLGGGRGKAGFGGAGARGGRGAGAGGAGARGGRGRGGLSRGGGSSGVPAIGELSNAAVVMDTSNQGFQDLSEYTEVVTGKKFIQRNRLFVGGVAKEMSEEDYKALFTEHGEINECYKSDKGFGFVTYDTRHNAAKAKQALDGKVVNGRPLSVRFSQHNAALLIKELPACVSNEMLYAAFLTFGPVERAVVISDSRGKPTGEGIVEFQRKHSAESCLRAINEGVFILSATPKPISVEALDAKDEEDGLFERNIQKNPQLFSDRSLPPRFAQPGSFEYEFGNRWKEIYAEEKAAREAVEQAARTKREQLLADMDYAYHDYEEAQLREELKIRQAELERMERERAQRLEAMKRRSAGGGSESAFVSAFGGMQNYNLNQGFENEAPGNSPWGQYQHTTTEDPSAFFGFGNEATLPQKRGRF